MITKYDIGDVVKTKEFTGTISMVTITKKGVKYRGFGTYRYENGSEVGHHQYDFWEDEIIEAEKH